MIAIAEPVLSDFTDLLTTAMRRKAAELGQARYTYRDLQRDSGVNFTYAQKAIRYGRIPSREIIAAWSRALVPHFPLDAALIAAYLPSSEQKRGILGALLDRAFESASEDVPESQEDESADAGAG